VKNSTIIPPKEGWQEHTWYLVEVAYNRHNPVHLSLFFSGFLNERGRTPGGYNGLQPLNYAGSSDGEATQITGVFYLKVLKKVISQEEAESEFPDRYLLPT